MSTLPNDTLVLDQQLFEQLQAEVEDYNQEFSLVPKQQSTTVSQPSTAPSQSGSSLFSISDDARMLFAMLFVALLFSGLFIFYREHFSNAATKRFDPLSADDTIYGIDFDAAIREMEQQENYLQSIRLRYLRLLRRLHDARFIFWQESKTPRQYTEELALADFSEVTHIFIKIRYGKYPADAQLNAEFAELCEAVENKTINKKQNV